MLQSQQNKVIIEPSDLVLASQSFIGTRFKHQGRSKEFGVDCLGLFLLSLKECGFIYPGFYDTNYNLNPDSKKLIRELNKYFYKNIYNILLHGNIFLIKFNGNPQHIAIYNKQNNSIIHSYASSRKVIEEPYTDDWRYNTYSSYTTKEIK